MRAWADDYYTNNLASTTIEHPKLGNIIFTNRGFEKPRSFSADPRKLKLVPVLPDIIKNGEVVVTECDRKNRKNIECGYKLDTQVVLEKENLTVRVIIRSDNNGNLYYDHYIKEPTSVSSITNEGVPWVSVKNISKKILIVNTFIIE